MPNDIAADADLDISDIKGLLIDGIFTAHIQRVEHLLRKATAEALAGLDLRTGSIGALAIIQAHPGCAQNDIVKRTTFDKSAVNAIVNSLEQLGWAERRKTETDRRRYALFATPEGEKALRRIISEIQKIEGRLMSRMTAADQLRLRRLLEKMHESCRSSIG
jgi:DNA-binding MarR family transcriptional regulator